MLPVCFFFLCNIRIEKRRKPCTGYTFLLLGTLYNKNKKKKKRRRVTVFFIRAHNTKKKFPLYSKHLETSLRAVCGCGDIPVGCVRLW